MKFVNVCRICSMFGMHNIHDRIPYFVHVNEEDYKKWQRPIIDMLQEVTGLKIHKNDGLPQNICSHCIFLLKCATVFRTQAIDNMKNIELAVKLGNIEKDEEMEEEEPDTTVATSISSSDSKVTTTLMLLQQIPPFAPKFQKHKRNEIFIRNELTIKLEEFFGESNWKEMNSDKYFSREAIENFFSYSEKPFIEDDSDIEELTRQQRLTIDVFPTDGKLKERKCPSCSNRYLFNESFQRHLINCIHLKLEKFIVDSYHLQKIRKYDGISPDEFLCRLIFNLKQIVLSVSVGHRYLTDNKRLIRQSSSANKRFEILSSGKTIENFTKVNSRKPLDAPRSNAIPKPITLIEHREDSTITTTTTGTGTDVTSTNDIFRVHKNDNNNKTIIYDGKEIKESVTTAIVKPSFISPEHVYKNIMKAKDLQLIKKQSTIDNDNNKNMMDFIVDDKIYAGKGKNINGATIIEIPERTQESGICSINEEKQIENIFYRYEFQPIIHKSRKTDQKIKFKPRTPKKDVKLWQKSENDQQQNDLKSLIFSLTKPSIETIQKPDIFNVIGNCPICESPFVSLEELEQHNRIKHNNRLQRTPTSSTRTRSTTSSTPSTISTDPSDDSDGQFDWTVWQKLLLA